MGKFIDRSCQDQHVAKDDSKTSKKRSALASCKLGAAGRVTNKEKLAGQLGKCQKSNLSQLTKLQSVPVMKRKIEKSAGAGPKVLSVYNLRSKDPIIEGTKDSPGYNLRSKVQKTEGGHVSTKKIPKKDCFAQKGIPKKERQRSSPLKTSVPPINKNLTTLMASLDKDQPLTSPYEPYFAEPMYHIRWEGDDMEDGPVGQNCIICNRDLSGVIEDDDDSEDDDDDLQYEHDEEDDDDALDYYDDLNPPLLPTVDILVCGHAYHTECFQQGTPEKQSGDPECPFCSKKA